MCKAENGGPCIMNGIRIPTIKEPLSHVIINRDE